MNFPGKLKILLTCDLANGTGYNHAARGLVRTLQTFGYTPETLHVRGAITGQLYQVDDRHPDWLNDFVFGPYDGEDMLNIVNLNPGMCGDYCTKFNGRYNVAYCAWETDRLPKAEYNINGVKRTVVGDLNTFDEVWVPLPFLREIFVQSGVTVPIYVIPHALQAEFTDAEASAKSAGKPFTFLSVGTWNARKNLDGLLRAYLSAQWTKPADVRLLIHAVPPARDQLALEVHSYHAQDAAKNLFEALPDKAAAPQFGIMTTEKRLEDIVALYRQAHCLVSASNGEGFGLPLVEALACGTPVIAGGPAWRDIIGMLHETGSSADIEYFVNAVPETSTPITPMPECRGYELDHRWWTLNRDVLLIELIRAAARTPPQDLDLIQRFQQTVRAVFSPRAVAGKIAPRLESIVEVVANTGW